MSTQWERRTVHVTAVLISMTSRKHDDYRCLAEHHATDESEMKQHLDAVIGTTSDAKPRLLRENSLTSHAEEICTHDQILPGRRYRKRTTIESPFQHFENSATIRRMMSFSRVIWSWKPVVRTFHRTNFRECKCWGLKLIEEWTPCSVFRIGMSRTT